MSVQLVLWSVQEERRIKRPVRQDCPVNATNRLSMQLPHRRAAYHAGHADPLDRTVWAARAV